VFLNLIHMGHFDYQRTHDNVSLVVIMTV
jgi:hypothetical protein